MARLYLSDEQRRQGKELGRLLQRLRGRRTSEELARLADVKVDTLRKIEAGSVPTPGFFMVGRIVEAAGGRLDELWAETRVVGKGEGAA